MKKVTLPDVSFGLRTEESIETISAGEQLRILVASPSKPGDVFTIDQIRARLPLVKRLEDLNGATEFLVEDSEYTELVAAVESSTWSGVSTAALALVDAVKGAEAVEVEEKGAAE